MIQGRKIAAFLLPALWAGTGFPAAAAAPTPAVPALTIWVSKDTTKKSIDQSSAAFAKRYGVEIKTYVVYDILTQYKTATIVGRGPDGFVWAHDVTGELAENGLIDPVHFPESLRPEFYQQAVDAFFYHGTLYGLPIGLEGLTLFYNKKLLRLPPKTVEELLAVSRGLRRRGLFGLLLPVDDFYFMFPFFSAQGVNIWARQGGDYLTDQNDLASPGALQAARLISSLTETGREPALIPHDTGHEAVRTFFLKGKAALMISGPWSLDDLNRSGMDYGIAPLPSWNGHPARPFLGVLGFFINRKSQQKLLMRQWTEEVLLSRAGQIALNDLDPKVPGRRDAFAELAKKHWFLAPMNEGLKDGVPMPNIPQMGGVFAVMKRSLAIIAGHKTPPQQAMRDASSYLQSLQRKTD